MFPPSEPTASFPYRILAKIGEGGMGAVYRARDLDLGRDVAIKVIKPEHVASLRGPAAQAAVDRFVQEARAAAVIAHPGVTTVHRIGTEDGWPYIAMEWLEGRSLLELLADEPQRFSVPQAVRIAIQVLSVLDVAHATGIVHRDIKPANLMLVSSGRVKVTDFGIARVAGSNLAHTQAGVILGTPHYAAPEQLLGKATDCRVDLYALGTVLYELLVGQPPFEGATIYELIHAVHDTDAVPPGTLVPGLPAGLEAVVMRALAKRPEDRFSSAAEMMAALQPYQMSAVTRATGVAVTAPAAVARAPVVLVEGMSASRVVGEAVRRWPPLPLGRQPTQSLLERVTERPLHTRPFCGALDTGEAILLVCDGIIYAAFEPGSGRTGDAVIEALPAEVDATLHAVPPEHDVRLVALLGAVVTAPRARGSVLDAAISDLGQLARKLAAEGFDGVLRLAHGDQLGLVMFSRGQRVVDVFSDRWPTSPVTRPWEAWIATSGATASVEPIQFAFPTITYRR